MELSKVIVTLFADTKEYMEKMDKAEGKMLGFGASADASSSKLTNFANKASTAMIGFGIAAVGYGVDAAIKFNEALDAVKNQSNLTDQQLGVLRQHIIDTSNLTGQSADNLANASLLIAQAGITGQKGFDLMNAAAKAAVITNADLTTTTQTLISAQTLQVAKGLSVADLTGKLVAGSKDFVGGLAAEEQMLSGRVGVALANYGLKLDQIIPLGAEFAKVGLPSRSVASFANALGTLENPTKAYAKNLAAVGLSASQLGAFVRSGNVVGLLKQINEAAQKGGGPLSQYVDAVFGKTGGSAASVLIKNLQDIARVQQQVAGGGSNSLAASFSAAAKQLGPQLKIFEANLTNALISVGQVVLPALSKLLSGLNGFFKDKGAVEAVGLTLGAAFVASVGLKIANLVKGIAGLFGKTAQVVATDANTAALEANTIALGGKTGGGVLPTIEKYGKFAPLLEAAALLGAGYLIKKTVLDKQAGALTTANNPLAYMQAPGQNNLSTSKNFFKQKGTYEQIGGQVFFIPAAQPKSTNTVRVKVTH